MQIAATTNQAALTASPRLSATIANATAPRIANAIHRIFVCRALDVSTVLTDVLPRCRKVQRINFLPDIVAASKLFASAWSTGRTREKQQCTGDCSDLRPQLCDTMATASLCDARRFA